MHDLTQSSEWEKIRDSVAEYPDVWAYLHDLNYKRRKPTSEADAAWLRVVEAGRGVTGQAGTRVINSRGE